MMLTMRQGFSLVEPKRSGVPSKDGIHLRQAFSLVELSIVLVILGLLTGGILAGQSLIRASELRSVTSDLQRYTAATNTFRDKYFTLPGDMTNATSFWGTRAGGGNLACQQTISTTAGTCNSDGNGSINNIAGDSTLGERFLAWQHLAYAGLIEGSYTGASANASSYVISPGVNIPRAKISNAHFIMFRLNGPLSGDTNYFDGSYDFNLIGFDSLSGTPLKPEEMWNIDTKLDDGLPASGNIFTVKNSSTYAPGCATTDIASTAVYSLSNSAKLCAIHYALR